MPDAEVVEARAAEANLRALAEEIAAEGVSPAHYARRVRRRVP
jgi:cyanophycinase